MKVNPNNGSIPIKQNLRVDEQAKAASKAQAPANADDSVVKFSADAGQVSQIRSKLDELPEVRMDKVDEIKKMVDEGTYNPDTEKVAEKLMTDSIFWSMYS